MREQHCRAERSDWEKIAGAWEPYEKYRLWKRNSELDRRPGAANSKSECRNPKQNRRLERTQGQDALATRAKRKPGPKTGLGIQETVEPEQQKR